MVGSRGSGGLGSGGVQGWVGGGGPGSGWGGSVGVQEVVGV